jgi:hypothetical protein
VKTYRCKQLVEAMRWTDTDENRELFASWFDEHDVMFETRGPVVVLPGLRRGVDADGENIAEEGEWIVWMDDDYPQFVVMSDAKFANTYEAVS